MAMLQPVTELNEEIRSKATVTILELEKCGELGDSTLIWNNLFFCHPDGTYYVTFHDIAYDEGYPHWLRSNKGTMEVKLWWVEGEILATGDLDDQDTDLTGGEGWIDSGKRRWTLTGPQMVELAEPAPPPPSALKAQATTPPAHRFSPQSAPTLSKPSKPSRGPTEVSFHPGQRVRHDRFGEGIVESSRLVENDEEVTIRFAERSRRILASFAKLERLD